MSVEHLVKAEEVQAILGSTLQFTLMTTTYQWSWDLSGGPTCQADGRKEYSLLFCSSSHSFFPYPSHRPFLLRAVQLVTGRRGLVVTRSTFPSSGQWSGHWLGDNRSNWTDMAHSLIGALYTCTLNIYLFLWWLFQFSSLILLRKGHKTIFTSSLSLDIFASSQLLSWFLILTVLLTLVLGDEKAVRCIHI